MITNQTYNSALTISIKAAEVIPKFRFINYLGEICTLGERALGVSSLTANQNTQVTIETLGTMLIETSTAISKGTEISSDELGKAKAATTGEIVNGIAMSSCSSAGVIKIKLVV